MRYARKCSITNEGMNEGWVGNDGEVYDFEVVEFDIKSLEGKGLVF